MNDKSEEKNLNLPVVEVRSARKINNRLVYKLHFYA